ncbi:MAG: GvpL/GvpF family gas vesicle protein [Pseudomonadota bacterium]
MRRIVAAMAPAAAARAAARGPFPLATYESGGTALLTLPGAAAPTGRRATLSLAVEHRRLLEHCQAHGAVLPAATPLHALPEPAIERLAAQHGAAFADVLQQLDGRAEFTVLVTWDPARALARPAPSLRAAAEGAEATRNAMRHAIGARVSASGCASVAHPDGGIETLFAAALLSPPSMAAVLDPLLEEIDLLGRGEWTVRCIGPLPPLSFCAVRLETVAAPDDPLASDSRTLVMKAAQRDPGAGAALARLVRRLGGMYPAWQRGEVQHLLSLEGAGLPAADHHPLAVEASR